MQFTHILKQEVLNFFSEVSPESAPPLNKHYSASLSIVATAVILAFSQTSLAYDFSIPKTPSLPTQLPSQTQNIDDSTSANSGTTNPASNWDWYGPLTNSLTNNDVHVTKLADRDVFGGWSINDAETVSSNRVVIEKDGSMKHVYGGYSRTGKTENNIVEVFGSTVQGDIPAIYGGYSKDVWQITGSCLR